MTDLLEETGVVGEVKAWLEENWDPELTVAEWWERLGTAGWAAPTLPVGSYGKGLSRGDAVLVQQAIADHGALGAPGGLGLLLAAPTIATHGTPEQVEEYVRPIVTGQRAWCQLFSEPGAGSDLAGLQAKAEQDGEEWIVNGQKVWTSGGQVADLGMLIARTDVDVPKHRGMTAFIIPMDLPGLEVRPIRQMSGGASFNEVFFTDVRVADSMRLGAEGDGWRVALTTLGFERDHSDGSGGSRVGGGWQQLLATARAMGVTADPATRRALTDAYIGDRVETFVNRRAAELARGGTPGPEGSLGKLIWTEGMRRTSDVISRVLGPALIADTGEWGTYAWGEHVLGAPGYRIAGGSDEVQRNIIAERVLGLPAELRVDKDIPFKDVPK